MTNSEVLNLKAGTVILKFRKSGARTEYTVKEVIRIDRCINERSKCFDHAYANVRKAEVIKYTPGPWHAEYAENNQAWSGWYIAQPGRSSGLLNIAVVEDVDYGPEIAEANARLIAAAPELLEALLTIVRGATHAMGQGSCGWGYARVKQTMLEKGRIAIAKATG